MLNRSLILVISGLTLGVAQSAQSALVLNLNTANKTFAITGSDSGTTNLFGTIAWNQATSVNYGLHSETFDNDLAFTTSAGTPGTALFPDTELRTTGDGTAGIILAISEISTFTTVTGTGVFQSYAGLGTGAAGLEEFIGGQIAPTASSLSGGWSPMAVQAVPEPASLIAIGGALAAFARRRRA